MSNQSRPPFDPNAPRYTQPYMPGEPLGGQPAQRPSTASWWRDRQHLKIVGLVVGGFLIFFTGFGMGSGSGATAASGASEDPSPTPTVTVTAEAEPAPTVTVTETVTPEAAAPAETQAATESSSDDATSGGVDYGVATVACDNALDQSAATSGYKWNGDPIIGMIDGRVTESDTYFAKYTGKLKNAAGGKINVTVECEVGGTDTVPIITNARVYDDAGNEY